MNSLRIPRVWLAVLLLLIATAVAFAAAPDERISKKVVAAGGGDLGYTQTSIKGTVGQSVVGRRQTVFPMQYLLRSGYWQPASGLSAVPDEEIPPKPILFGNSPNPFNPMTEIRFAVGLEARTARLMIYDIQGRLVRTLVDGVVQPGTKKAVWQGHNDQGGTVASGIYFYRLQVGDEVFTQKMLLLK